MLKYRIFISILWNKQLIPVRKIMIYLLAVIEN